MTEDSTKTKPQLIQELEEARTKIAKAESALLDLESKYRSVVKQANVGIVVIQDQIIKFANQKMEEITGYSLVELEGKVFLDMVHPEDHDMLQTKHHKRLSGEELESIYDFKAMNRQGEIRWFETKPMKIDWNQQNAALCFVSDVTEKRLAEENLKISERRFKTVLESTGYGYYETDEYGTFTFVNDQLAAIIGYPKHEIIGSNYRSFTDEENARKTYQVFDAIFKEKIPFGDVDHLVTRKDGSPMFVHMSITLLLDANQEPIGFKGLIHDITAQRENEQKLKELHQKHIEVAHTAGMAEMASNTLHNVGNILNSVKVSGQAVASLISKEPYNMHSLEQANAMLKGNLSDLKTFITSNPNGKKLLEYLVVLIEEIVLINKEASADIDRLLNNIRLIENVVSAQQTYAGLGALTDYHSLADIVENALVLKSALLEERQILVNKQYGDVPKIPVQKSKLVHIMINLINNAIDSMQETQPDRRILTISIEQEEAAVYLKVSDTGKGIDRGNLSKVFKHGYTTKEGGHGFGLHSSADYMSSMNGHIRVESDGEGKGATFVLQFKK